MMKAREFHKNMYFCFIDYAKAFDCVDHNKLENSERDGNTRPPDLPPENFEHYFTSVEMSAIVRQFEHSLALPFFGTGTKTDLFQSCGHC